jgi:uncharacterized membrane protein
MRCPKCGKESQIGAEFCVRCGAPSSSKGDARAHLRSEGDGLPEVKRHLNEMALRLSKVEGRVTLISQRIGLEPGEPEPATTSLEDIAKAEMPPEVVGEAFPVELLATQPPMAAASEPPMTAESPPAALVLESAAPAGTDFVKDAKIKAEAPTAAETVLVEPVAVESAPGEFATPEVLPPSAAAEPIAVVELLPSSEGQPKASAMPVEQMVPLGPTVVEAATPEPARAEPVAEEVSAKAAAAPVRPPRKPPKPPQPSQFARRMREWEQALPGNWLSRIGMLVLFIGLGFLTQWAYVNDKLVRLPLLLVGLACGGVLLFAGHHWGKKYGAWAQALTGGGIGVLYLSLFASYALYLNDPRGPVMPFEATFACMFLVTLLAVGIALRRNSMSIAILGIVGAFLVPMTLGAVDQSANGGTGGSGGNNTPALIAYVLILDVAVVWLASLRNWRWFTLLGFVGSMAIFSLWYCTAEDKNDLLVPAQGMLTGIFLCFAAATTLFHGLWRHRPQLTDLGLMTVNAAVYFGVSHYLLWEDGYQHWLGGLGFGLAAFYAVLGYLFLRRSKENSLLAAFAFAIAITFVTVAIPVQFEKSHMTAAWAAEGAVLMWLAVRYGTARWQLWSLGAFALVLVKLFARDQIFGGAGFHPIMNNMFWAFAPSAVAFFAAAWFLRRKEKALQPWFFPMMMLLGNFLTVWLFSFEIINFADSRIVAAHVGGTVGYDFRSVENARNLALVGLWGLYGLTLVFAGTRKGWVWLRLGGYALVIMAVGTTLVELNYAHARITGSASSAIANYGFGALAVCVSVLGMVAYIIRSHGDKMTPSERAAFLAVASMANTLAVYALSAEVITFLGDWDVRNLVLVALWAAYGLGVMIVGLSRGWSWLRAQGWLLGLMAVGMTVTTLNYGHFLMRNAPGYPIGNFSFAAFAICIAVAASLAYLVSAYGKRLHAAETSAFPILVSLASILTLYALSAEVFTFLDNWDVRNLVLVALWAAYGLGVVVVGLWRGWRWLRTQGWLLALAAIGMTMTTLNYGRFLMDERPLHPIGNYSFGAFAICVCMVSALAWLVAGNRKRFDAAEASFFPGLVLLANFLTLWAFSSEVMTFVGGADRENIRNLVLVFMWCAYGLGLLLVGIGRKWDWLRVAGYVLAVVAAGTTLALLNHSHADVGSAYSSMPILNYSLGGFAVSVVALYLCAYAIAKNRERLHEFEKGVCIAALVGASVLTLWGLSEEIVAFLEANVQNLMLVILWLGYGSLLMVLGVARRALLPRIGACALVVMGVGATAILLNHWWADIGPEEGSWPILNYSFGALVMCVVACYLFAYLTGGRGEKADRFDQVTCAIALGLANVLTIWALSAEVITFLTESLQSLVLVIVWSGYGLLLMLAGTWKGVPAARFAGHALIVAAIAMTATMLNHAQAGLGRSSYNAVINPSFGGFLVCVMALYAASYLMGRNSGKLFDAERVVLTLLVVAANVLSLYALSMEVWTYAPAGSGQSMGLTTLWAAYGTVLVVVGLVGRRAWVRLGGLALVSVAVLKLFVVDTLDLELPYRVAAYITVGVLLLAGGFVYHRYADVIKGFIMDRPEKGAGSTQK